MTIYSYFLLLFFFYADAAPVLFLWQVGESDEKLADRIKLFAVSTVPQAKRSMLNDLISVSTLNSLLKVTLENL